MSISARPPFSIRIARASAIVLFLASFVGGCARVAPYERGRLAHPTMAPGDFSSPGREHIYAIQEAATGGSAEASSGCGCN